MSHFLKAWATISSRHHSASSDQDGIITGPNCSHVLGFPTFKLGASKIQNHDGKDVVQQEKLSDKRVVFDENSIRVLRTWPRATKSLGPLTMLTCFIWKHASIAAATAKGRKARPSVAGLAVNLRPRMKSKLALDNSIGNLFWWTRSATVPDVRTVGISELVSDEGIAGEF
uniref:Uncharacterized protein n=1 Tax=Cannabis sativa TaxID=3483 RepID=A0A803QUT4_CANSA